MQKNSSDIGAVRILNTFCGNRHIVRDLTVENRLNIFALYNFCKFTDITDGKGGFICHGGLGAAGDLSGQDCLIVVTDRHYVGMIIYNPHVRLLLSVKDRDTDIKNQGRFGKIHMKGGFFQIFSCFFDFLFCYRRNNF